MLWILIFAVVAAVTGNYFQTRHKRGQSAKEAAELLSADLLRSAKNIEYTSRREGEVQFILRAAALKETRGGTSLLKGIEAYDLNPDGTMRNQIRSRQAEYDRDGGKAVFTGDVRLQLGNSVQLRTESLRYDLAGGLATTDDRVGLEAPEVRGSASGLRYNNKGEELELHRDLDFVINRVQIGPDGSARTEGYTVRAQRGRYTGGGRAVQLEGGVRVTSEQGVIAGDSVEAKLTGDQKQISAIVCRGNALYERLESGQTRRLQGDEMSFELSQAGGGISTVNVLGRARLFEEHPQGSQELRGNHIWVGFAPSSGLPEAISSQGDAYFRLVGAREGTTMQGDTIDVRFRPETNLLQTVGVRDHAKLVLGPGEGASEQLEADWIQLSFQEDGASSDLREIAAERSVRWRSQSALPGGGIALRNLSSDALRLQYAATASGPESGSAAGRVVFDSSSGRKPGAVPTASRLHCDRADFTFHAGGRYLKSLMCTGHVEVSHSDPERRGTRIGAGEMRASSVNLDATFAEADGAILKVNLRDQFTYSDGLRDAHAQRCEYSAESDVLVLSGDPEIKDRSSTTRGERVVYDRSREILDVTGGVRTVIRSGRDAAGVLLTEPSTASGPSIVTAEHMQYWTAAARVAYSGEVQLLSERGQLLAKTLTMTDSGAEIEATGGIRHVISQSSAESPGNSRVGPGGTAAQPVVIMSDSLRYKADVHSIVYAGGVTLSSRDLRLSSLTLQAFLDKAGNRIDHAEATGRVRITQGQRQATGDTADYDLSPQKFVVVGGPAVLTDAAHGRSEARRLTFSTSDDRILLEKR
jgi:LPS export ABC transporter protein LptC